METSISKSKSIMEINEIDLSIDNDIVDILKKNGFNKVTWTREEIKNWLRINFNVFVDILPLYNESDLPLTKTNRPLPYCFYVWEWHNDVFNIEEAKKFSKYEDAENYGILIHLKMIYE